jgi:hypothetical protein
MPSFGRTSTVTFTSSAAVRFRPAEPGSAKG